MDTFALYIFLFDVEKSPKLSLCPVMNPWNLKTKTNVKIYKFYDYVKGIGAPKFQLIKDQSFIYRILKCSIISFFNLNLISVPKFVSISNSY